jgi:hypothetical protein
VTHLLGFFVSSFSHHWHDYKLENRILQCYIDFIFSFLKERNNVSELKFFSSIQWSWWLVSLYKDQWRWIPASNEEEWFATISDVIQPFGELRTSLSSVLGHNQPLVSICDPPGRASTQL